MDLAEEWQHVVLAETEHLHVFDDDHLIVVDGKQSACEQLLGIFLISLGQILQGTFHALRCALQALALRIFAQAHKHLT